MNELYEFARQQIGKDPSRSFEAVFNRIDLLARSERGEKLTPEEAKQIAPPAPAPVPEPEPELAPEDMGEPPDGDALYNEE